MINNHKVPDDDLWNELNFNKPVNSLLNIELILSHTAIAGRRSCIPLVVYIALVVNFSNYYNYPMFLAKIGAKGTI